MTFLCFTGVPGIVAAAIIGFCCVLAAVVIVDVELADRKLPKRERTILRSVFFGGAWAAFLAVALLTALAGMVLGSFFLDTHDDADRTGTTVEPLVSVYPGDAGYAASGADGGFRVAVKRDAEIVSVHVPRLQVSSGDPQLITRASCTPRDIGLVWLDGETFTCKTTVTAHVPQ